MLLCLLLAAAEVDRAEAPRADPSVAVWLQPLGLTIAPALVAATGSGTYVSVPLGVNIAFETWQLAIETTVYTYRGPRGSSAFTGGTFTLGPVLHTGDLKLGGFMLVPKIAIDLMHETSRNVTSFSVLPGVDFGWQRCFGPLYFALVVGVSGGWSMADGDWVAGPGLNPTLPASGRPVVGVNLNLLRIGGAF